MLHNFQLKSKTILIISNEPWGKQWFIKHHIAKELSINNLVYFIDPPQKFKIPFSIKLTSISENLYCINYSNPLPASGRFNPIRVLNDKLVSFFICYKFNSRKKFDLVISFDPFRLLTPKSLAQISIYYSVDLYSNSKELIVSKNSDINISVSEKIATKINTINIIPHGTPFVEKNFQNCINKCSESKIVFCSASFSSRIDFELLFKLANKHNSLYFKFAGPILINPSNDNYRYYKLLLKLDNVEFLGVLSYGELNQCISESIICLVPYRMDNPANTINSLKILQYLSLGKNIVSTKMTDYILNDNFNQNLFKMATTQEEFIRFFEEYSTDPIISFDTYNKRYDFASKYFYNEILIKLEEIINL